MRKISEKTFTGTSGEGIVEEENVSSFYQKQIPYGVHTLTLTLH